MTASPSLHDVDDDVAAALYSESPLRVADAMGFLEPPKGE
jgi:hypothetical protein